MIKLVIVILLLFRIEIWDKWADDNYCYVHYNANNYHGCELQGTERFKLIDCECPSDSIIIARINHKLILQDFNHCRF